MHPVLGIHLAPGMGLMSSLWQVQISQFLSRAMPLRLSEFFHSTEFPVATATVEGVDHDPIVYLTISPFNVTSALPIFATSNDTTIKDDACNPLPDNTPDLSPFLTVIRRGMCSNVSVLPYRFQTPSS